jgi:FkbM family methyltransferase
MLPLRILRRVFYGAPGIVQIDDFDQDLTIELRLSEHMQSRIFWMGYYSQEVVSTLNDLLRPGMTLIDVGANIGEISMVSAKRVGGSGRVLAFEPLSSHADRLEANLRKNGLDWVSVARVAVSDYEGTTEIYESCGQGTESDEHFGLNSLYRAQDNVAAMESIGVTTLDSFLSRSPLDRIDVIKIDIEGSELPCLIGARETIARYLPYIVVEVQSQSARAAGYEQGDILRELERHGYQFQLIGPHGSLQRVDATTLRTYQNILCVPPQHPTTDSAAA